MTCRDYSTAPGRCASRHGYRRGSHRACGVRVAGWREQHARPPRPLIIHHGVSGEVEQAYARLAEMEERVEFTERMLTQQAEQPRIAGSSE